MNYKVQKFHISYVKERDTLNKAIEEKRVISSKHDVTEFIKNYLSDLPIEKVSEKLSAFTKDLERVSVLEMITLKE